MGSLDAALHKANQDLTTKEKKTPKSESVKPVSTLSPTSRVQRRKNNKPSREGTTLVGGHLPKEYGSQLLILAAEETVHLGRRITHVELLKEALNDLFVKKGKKVLT